MSRKAVAAMAAVLIVVVGASAYYLTAPKNAGPEIVRVDGSSTVFPITSAWAEQFNNPTRQVVVAFSGTGGGFQKWCRGETDLSDASRPIKQSERDECAAHDITGIVEYRVAYDGLSVVVHKSNTWATSLTVKGLCRIWTSNTSASACGGAGPHVTKWSELDASWPDQTIKLYGPGTDSGTYDYFREVILDPYKTPITDQFFPSEDDNILVQGVESDVNALGYFGYAYAKENLNRLNLVAIDDQNATNGAGPIVPSESTVRDGTYKPLGRPLFVYAHAASLAKTVVKDFLRFGFSDQGQLLVGETGYVTVTAAERAAQQAKIPA